jgi:hypothetical protein
MTDKTTKKMACNLIMSFHSNIKHQTKMKNIKILPWFILSLLIFNVSLYAEGEDKLVTLSGYIKDAETGEELIGANVYISGKSAGTTTNVYGFYSISLNPGKYTFVFSFVGYQPSRQTINLTENKTLNIELAPKEKEIKEIVVKGEKPDENVVRNQMSYEKIKVKKLSELPTFLGETDIIKSIQLLPGVQTISEGSSGYSVRGGSQDQNLVLLDEATVYNISHFLGFFSVFNNDAIKNAELYKGDIPARYGTRLASVLDIRMKDGNSKKFAGTGGIGNISSRLTLEGPIIKDKTSFLVSGRRTYFDLFIPLIPEEDIQGNKIYFYDLNAKLNHKINENNRIYLSGYFGQDKFKNDFSDIGYGNRTVTLRWNHLYSERLFSNVTLINSKYDYSLASPEDEAWSYKWDSKLIDYCGKIDFTWYLNPSNTVRFGLSSCHHTFDPGRIKGTGEESLFTNFKIPNKHTLEHGLYISNEQNLTNQLTLKYGLRLSVFQNIGKGTYYNYNQNYNVTDSTYYEKGEIYNTYIGIEPRLGIKYQINNRSSVKASYSRTRQHIQLAQNSTAGTPLDIWFPASPNVKPQICDQFALGYFRNFFNNQLETSVEAYYKDMKHTIDFKDHASLLLNPKLEGELRFGDSYSYGIEFMSNINTTILNGRLSYTYSRTKRIIPAIQEDPFNAPYDRPHNISLVMSYSISPRTVLSANWTYKTGQPVTFPTGRFEYDGVIVPVFSDRNDYRLSDYHRLDLSLTIKSKDKPGKKWKGEWNFSIYNAYARKNTWAISFIQDENNPDITYAEKTYLFSIIPSITYNFKF